MTNKQSIMWHEECYSNWKQSLDTHEERTIKELEKIKQDRIRLEFYDDQIKSAKIIGKDGFDRDKFKVKRKPLTSATPTSKEGMELTLSGSPDGSPKLCPIHDCPDNGTKGYCTLKSEDRRSSCPTDKASDS